MVILSFEVAFHHLKGDRIMDNTHRIVQVKGHYEVHDSNGNFVLSGDSWDECYNDLVDMLIAETRTENHTENIRGVVA